MATGGGGMTGAALKLPGYRVERVVGKGSQGVVVRAVREADGQVVAIKVLSSAMASSSEMRGRFRREAAAAIELKHPNLIAGLEAGLADGRPFVVMEFVEGETLKIRASAAPLTEAQALPLLRQVAEALIYAHERKLVHRDIKPENIMVTTAGVAKLMDLGLAKDTEAAGDLTMQGAVFGTLGYISPEAAKDSRAVDTRSDIYSLGATFFRVTTGDVPMPATSLVRAMARLTNEDPPDPRAKVPALSQPFARLLLKMLSRDPKARPQTPTDLLADIDLVIAGKPPSGPPPRAGSGVAPAPGTTGKGKSRPIVAPGGEAPKRAWWRRLLWPFGSRGV